MGAGVSDRPRFETVKQLAAILVAQAGDAPAGGAEDPFGGVLPMLFIMLAVMYVMVIRPAQKEKKQHQGMLDSLMRGDEVLTSSGIVGKVADISDAVITLEVARNVKIRVVRSAVAKKYAEAKKAEAEAPKTS